MSARHRPLIILLAGLLSPTVIAADDDPAITLANVEWPPFTSHQLTDDGYISRRVTDAFAISGVQVRYVFLPWKRALEETRDGRFAGTLVWAHTEDRDRDFLYSDPILVSRYVLFYNRNRPVHWEHLQDLHGLTIGGVLGATPTGEYGDLINAGVFKREVSASDELNLRKLAAGHLDAAAIELEVGQYLLANEDKDIADQVGYDPKSVVVVPDYLLISKKTSHGEELMHRFNQGLAALPANKP